MYDNLAVALVGPEYPINVGYTARILKNFGIRKLYMIEPRVDLRIASVYASHGADLLRNVEELSFEELRRRHELLVATTAIKAMRRGNVIRTSSEPEEVIRYIKAAKSTALVFGRDTTGLTNKELAGCDIVVSVDTGTKYRTLNVSHAVAILLYLLSKKDNLPRNRSQSLYAREAFVKYSCQLALASGLQRHRAEKLREILKRVSIKSELNDKEIMLLVALLRKTLSALGRNEQSNNYEPSNNYEREKT